MTPEFRILNSEFRRKLTVNSGQWVATRLAHCARSLFTIHYSLFTALLLFTVHCSLSTALAATHVTATYDLGANPKVMATVNGTPQYGLVFAQRNKPVTYGDVEYGPSVLKGYLNASGQLNDGASHLWLDLIPNLGATPGDSYYVVTFNIQGRVHAEIWVVPDVATVAAEVCRQAQPPSSTAPALFYQFLQQDGDDLPQRQKLNLTGSGVACADNAGQLRTDCTVTGGGGGSAPKASATVSGTVKTDATESDPVVYLKSSADTLLAAKAPLAHSHPESEVTNLTADLAGKVPATRAINTTSPLSGGGALSSDLTLSLPAASSSQNGYLTSANWTTFNNKENALTFNSPLSRAVNAISCPTCEITGNKNAASGYAGLDASTKLAAAQLPTPGATTLGGVKSLTCGGTDKLSAIGTDGVPTCSADQTGGGSSHEILSATHTDTTAASVVRGDLITGQGATPKWTRLAKGTQYQVLTGGANEPAWSAVALDQSNAVSGVLAASNGGTGSAYFAVSGPASTAKTFTFPNQNATMEYQANKNAASGYAGLTAGTKLNAAQGQEVWSSADLTDFADKSGTGTTIMGATFTSLAANDIPKWNGTNWVNSASAAKADALTNDPSDCGSNQYATAIAANGNLTCSQPATSNLSDGANVVKNNQANTYSGGGLQDLSANKLALPAATTLPATCAANKEIYVDTDATPAGQQVYLCNAAGNGWNLIGDGGGGGGGTTVTVNGASVNSTADLDDSTPAAPANGVNVKWQKDASNPTNISAYWLSTAVGSTTFGSGSSFTWSFNDQAASNSTIQFDAGGINITPATGMVYVASPLQAEYGDAATGNLLTLYGDAVSTHTSGTRTVANAVRGYVTHDGAGGTVTNAVGVSGLVGVGAGTISAAMALQAQSPTKGAGTIGNAFGLYVQAQTAGTNNYAIWTNGAEQSRFGGLINAVGGFQVNGAATNHAVLLGNGAIFQASGAIPNCQDTGGNHLNYTQSSQAFSCGTSGGGSGITSLNTLTAATQTFATPGTSGTAPNWSSVTDTHTLNIPLASASSVTAGLISKTDYDSFTAKPSLVTAGTNGIAAYNAGDDTTAARSDHTHRSIHNLTWYFPGTPPTGVANMQLTIPEGVTNIALLDMRVTATTYGSGGSTFNIQRCFTGGAACNATTSTWVDIYSSVLTLAASNYTASKGSAPNQNNTSLVAGDRFRASLVSVGSSLADVTVTLTVKYETTN